MIVPCKTMRQKMCLSKTTFYLRRSDHQPGPVWGPMVHIAACVLDAAMQGNGGPPMAFLQATLGRKAKLVLAKQGLVNLQTRLRIVDVGSRRAVPAGVHHKRTVAFVAWYVICSCRVRESEFVKARDLKEETGWLFGANVSVSAAE